MKLKLFLILVLVIAGGGAIFVSMGGLAANAADTTYLTAEAAVGDVTDEVAATGSVATVTSYGLTFGSAAHPVTEDPPDNPGTWSVDTVDVAVGDTVSEGDILAAASTADLHGELTVAIANRRSAAIQYEIAQEGLDDADTTDETRQAELAFYGAQSQLIQAEAAQHELEAQIAAATLVAPIDGVISAVNVTAGQPAPSGDAIVIDAATFEISADVVESDISSISIGQPAAITVDAIEAQVEGTVTAIASAASDGESGVVSYAVTVALADPPEDLRAGMTADITITTASAAGVLAIPAAALDGRDGAYTVQVLGADGTPETRTVEVGLVTNSLVEVTSGLAAGETVVTGTAADLIQSTSNSGQGGFRDGGEVIVGPPGGGFVKPGN